MAEPTEADVPLIRKALHVVLRRMLGDGYYEIGIQTHEFPVASVGGPTRYGYTATAPCLRVPVYGHTEPECLLGLASLGIAQMQRFGPPGAPEAEIARNMLLGAGLDLVPIDWIGERDAWHAADVSTLARATWLALYGDGAQKLEGQAGLERLGGLVFDECPYCRGRSPDEAMMDLQLQRGDTSGACSTCNNTHRVLRAGGRTTT